MNVMAKVLTFVGGYKSTDVFKITVMNSTIQWKKWLSEQNENNVYEWSGYKIKGDGVAIKTKEKQYL